MEMQSFGKVKRGLMRKRFAGRRIAWLAAGAAAALALSLMAGCKQKAAAPTDQQLTSAIQSKIQGEQALDGQKIQVSVSKGVATLSGTAANAASRALAGNDAGSVSGVRTVVNNMTVQPVESASAAPAAGPPAVAAPAVEQKTEQQREQDRARREEAARRAERARREQAAEEGNLAQASGQANLAPVPGPAAAPAPPAPPKPVIRRVTIPAGTVVPVTLTETLDSKTAETNEAFHGALAGDLMENGVVAIPRGAPVLGEVMEAKKAGHFRGQALLAIQLTQVTVHGRKIGLMTDTYTDEGGGKRGRNTAEKSGGGALFGALIGALAGGGKGAAVGALAGGGAGAGVNAVTRGKEAVIPSEAQVDFRLQEPITVTVYPPGSGEGNQGNEPRLMGAQR